MCKKKMSTDLKAIIIVYTVVNIILIISGIILVSLPNYGINMAIYPLLLSALLITTIPIVMLVDKCLKIWNEYDI